MHPLRERGTITLWMLGCCMMLFAVGGISVDLWRSFSVRRSLAAAADAAALSGASAIDEDRYRSAAAVELVPELAEARARASLRHQLDATAMRSAEISADSQTVTVKVRGEVGLTLLRLVDDRELDIAVAATATPRRPS
jgi:Flp pilus assembly protein TadG